MPGVYQVLHVLSIQPSEELGEVNTFLILQTRGRRLRKARPGAQRHTAETWLTLMYSKWDSRWDAPDHAAPDDGDPWSRSGTSKVPGRWQGGSSGTAGRKPRAGPRTGGGLSAQPGSLVGFSGKAAWASCHICQPRPTRPRSVTLRPAVTAPPAQPPVPVRALRTRSADPPRAAALHQPGLHTGLSLTGGLRAAGQVNPAWTQQAGGAENFSQMLM